MFYYIKHEITLTVKVTKGMDNLVLHTRLQVRDGGWGELEPQSRPATLM